MRIFSWITKDTNINFMGRKKLTYGISVVCFVLAVILIAVKGFNFGIDFSGGILMEIKSEQPLNLTDIRNKLESVNIGEVNLQTIGDKGDELMIRAEADNLDEEGQRLAVKNIKEVLGSDIEYRKIETVGPQVGDELKVAGTIASLIAILAISAYIWIRFEWQFALGALVSLFHDVIITLGLLSLFGMDFSLTTIAAILTLAGYSVNDKVVTYDRIRENLRKFTKMPQEALLNKSINDIFSRTLLTGFSTIFAALALLIFGGETLRSFAFTIVWGVIVGTYSSIYVATGILDLFDLRKTQEASQNVNPFGNVE
ncbi:MAG: protein translocase subunit SecF [Alphaproteobacteria bacterium]|nr:protein translocase subunit SecF [Alphaproteobacteria bacterium]MBQ8631558.1 protein translocase subunit SecF [Alphaproteobacteria bacterium]